MSFFICPGIRYPEVSKDSGERGCFDIFFFFNLSPELENDLVPELKRVQLCICVQTNRWLEWVSHC